MRDDCPSCLHMQRDCGGHWSRRSFPRSTAGTNRTGRMTLDIYDGTQDHDAHAYKEYETDD